MNQIGQIIAQKLESIEQGARQTLRDVEAIRGVCVGYAAAMSDFNAPPPPQTYHSGNGFQEIVSEPAIAGKTVASIIEEVRKLIIELKIKGSVREHRNGLIKFTNAVFGCVYGRTKEEIEKKLKEKIKQYKNKSPNSKSQKTKSPLLLDFYKTEFLPYKKRQGLTAHYLEQLNSYMRFIEKQHFNKSLSSYTTQMIETFLFSVPETNKRHVLQMLLNSILARAQTLNIIKTNPCTTVEKMRHKVETGKAFSFAEQIEFFNSLYQSKQLSYMQKCYFIFLYLTGTRKSEALSIKTDDVDFENKILSVRGTKTEGSNRRIPLTPLVEKLLQSLKPQKGRYFPLEAYTINNIFRVIWEKSKHHKPHDLRHTFGTIQICAEKIDVKTVSLWMGHSTINTTVNIYTHPEQLDNSTFLRGDISNDEKTTVYREKYGTILTQIEKFIK